MIRFFLKLMIALLLCVSSILVNAQSFQGKAFYQTQRNIDIKLDSTQMNDAMQMQFQKMLKKQFEKTYVLTFGKATSLYKEEKKLEAPNPAQSGIIIESVGGSNILFKDVKQKMFVSVQESFRKKLLISDSLKFIDWKMGKETKMIGKYLCIRATYIKRVDDYDNDLENLKEYYTIHIIR